MSIVISVLILSVSISACGNDTPKEKEKTPEKEQEMTASDSLEAQIDSLEIESEYDLTTVDEKDQGEFLESLAKIENKFGTQWDFCTCIVKRDSMGKVLLDPSLSDVEFEKAWNYSEEVDKKCKAFQIQSANQTPEERMAHEKKVNKCLKEAGLR